MPNYVVIGRQIGPLSIGEAFRPPGFAVAMRVVETAPDEPVAVVNTSLTTDEAEKVLEEMKRRGEIDAWREEYSGYVPLGTIYPTGDEGTIRQHFSVAGVPDDALVDMTLGIADTGTPPPAAQEGPLSEYDIISLDGAVDTQGHATAVASCTFAKYLIFAQALPNGSGSETTISQAIRALADASVQVINLSLGYPGQNPPRSEVIDAAVRDAQRKGILVGAAAGNSGWNANYGSPQAVCDFVWGASTLDGSAPAVFSSGGSQWEIETGAVPGEHVGVAHLDGGYGVADGTSFSAPLGNSIAGALNVHRRWEKDVIVAYCREHTRPYSPMRRRGLVVVNENDVMGQPPVPVVPGWEQEIDAIASEVWRLANNAQLAAQNGDLWAGVNALGPVKDYMDQIKALLPKADPRPPEPVPPPGPDEDWAGLLSGAVGLAGKQKWYAPPRPNANGIDIFVKRGTVICAPFAGTVQFTQVPGGPMLIGQMTLTHKDGRCVRYRHVSTSSTATVLQGQAVEQGFALSAVLVNDPSMDMLRWPRGYPLPPDGYQHLDLSLASHPSRLDPTGGAGGDVNAYQHIWGKMGGIPGIQIIDRTPGPQDGMTLNAWS